MLDLLVSLTGHHHHVTGSRLLQSQPDRLSPVELDRGPGGTRASLDLPRYLLRVLRVGVVRSNEAHVGEKGGYPPHPGPLRPIPVSCGPEHADNPPSATGYSPGHPQDGIQPNVGVGVVYDHLEPVVPGCRDPFEASRNLSHSPHGKAYGLVIRPHGEREGGGPGDVEHVVRPEQRRLELEDVSVVVEREARPAPGRPDPGDPVIRAGRSSEGTHLLQLAG